MHLLPPTLLLLIHATLATPSPALVSSDYAISLVPHHTLFLRQLSDLQTFSGTLGGTPAAPITNSGDKERPFSVQGDTFDQFESAAQRSCDVQFKGCSDAANGNGGGASGGGNGGGNQGNSNNGRGNGGGGSGNGNGNGERKSKRKGKDNNNDSDGSGNGDNSNNTNNSEKRQNNGGGLTVNQCDEQKSKCNDAQKSATVKDFQSAVASTNIGPDPEFPDFDLICEA